MSDAAPSLYLANVAGDGTDGHTLTPAAIDRILTDFRAWLNELVDVAAPVEAAPAVDWHTVIGQFTALRHEINLQTKAARAALEQNGESLAQLSVAVDELRARPEADNGLDPLLKAVLDVHDNLALAVRQVERQRTALEEPLLQWEHGVDIPEPPALPSRGPGVVAESPGGFWTRMLGRRTPAPDELAARRQSMLAWREQVCAALAARQPEARAAAGLVRASVDGLIAGYRMSLARVERLLDQFELQRIPAVGEAFDPELMEVVEVVGDTGLAAGTVVEEVRRGYVRDESVFRYAQVKVAR